jgi:hypothetical protein
MSRLAKQIAYGEKAGQPAPQKFKDGGMVKAVKQDKKGKNGKC